MTFTVRGKPTDLNEEQEKAFNVLINKINDLADLLDVKNDTIKELTRLKDDMRVSLDRERAHSRDLLSMKDKTEKRIDKMVKSYNELLKNNLFQK